MNVAIAGSRRLPKGQAPRLLIRFLVALPEDAVILMRRPMVGAPGPFEQDVENLCGVLHLSVQFFKPEPTETTRGRSSVYLRDIEMIEHADLALVFFAADEVADGYSGTTHLLDKALAADRPVYAYAIDEDGHIERVGEYDPDHLYVDIAPSA
jgi:hypothetical protein